MTPIQTNSTQNNPIQTHNRIQTYLKILVIIIDISILVFINLLIVSWSIKINEYEPEDDDYEYKKISNSLIAIFCITSSIFIGFVLFLINKCIFSLTQ